MEPRPNHGLSDLPEAQARKMEAIGRLTSGIAHEINTPMQYIGDNASYLRSEHKNIFQLIRLYQETIGDLRNGKIPPKEVLDRIQSEEARIEPDFLETEILRTLDQTIDGIERVTKIVLALREFSRPARHGIAPAEINRGIVVTTNLAVREWKYVADLDLNLDENLPRVHCRIDEINQVVLNLVINAAHAIKEKIDAGTMDHGKISISTSRELDMVKMVIEDDGVGIPEENLPKIFDAFFTTKEPGLGTGQGLAIVWDIITRKHRGRIEVESKPGKGTKFIILLPLLDPSIAERAGDG